MRKLIIAGVALALAAPATAAFAHEPVQNYYQREHREDHREYRDFHEDVAEEHEALHEQGGFYSRRDHARYHRTLRREHREVHRELPNTEHDHYGYRSGYGYDRR